MSVARAGEAGQQSDEPSRRKLILGVDGGGTKTDARLWALDESETPEQIASARAGTSNFRAAPGVAGENLAAAIQEALADTNTNAADVSHTVVALAGAGDPAVRNAVAELLGSLGLIGGVQVVRDVDALAAATSTTGASVVLIVGTGSIAYARDSEGKEALAGGWGYWIGDEGAACWIGRQALKAVALADDHRSQPTRLTAAVTAKFNAATPRELPTRLSETQDLRSATAELAPIVTQLAEQGDATADAILAQAADELTGVVDAARSRASIEGDYTLGLTGGVVLSSDRLRKLLMSRLQEAPAKPRSVELVNKPVVGCLQIALEQAAQD